MIDLISVPKGIRNIQIWDNSATDEPTLLARNLIRAFEIMGLATEYENGKPTNKVVQIHVGKKAP
jgi:hypothetical protein